MSDGIEITCGCGHKNIRKLPYNPAKPDDCDFCDCANFGQYGTFATLSTRPTAPVEGVLERVARAIYRESYQRCCNGALPSETDDSWRSYEGEARAALAAMGE